MAGRVSGVLAVNSSAVLDGRRFRYLRLVESDGPEKVSQALEALAAAGGALAGTALTLVAGPFVGSATGELVGRTLLLAGQAVEKRVLEPRRQKRLGEALSSATEQCRERLARGESVRSDGFFDPRMADGEVPAEEIAEGVLQIAADQWETRKVPYIFYRSVVRQCCVRQQCVSQ
jgi:hypothetical protein